VRHRRLSAIRIEPFAHTDDELHDYWNYFAGIRTQFAEWLNNDDPVIVANALVVLTLRAKAMLSGQVRQQGETFEREGGFRERMSKRRVEVRDAQAAAEAPACPDCGPPSSPHRSPRHARLQRCACPHRYAKRCRRAQHCGQGVRGPPRQASPASALPQSGC
jgi:four helix bundle suffix protein